MKTKTLALAAAAVMGGLLSFSTAQAANVMSGAGALPAVEKSQTMNIQPASHKKWRKWRGGGDWRWRHRRHGFGRSGVFLGLGLAPFYGGYSPYYAQPYYDEPDYYIQPAGGSRHVRWCYDRYRSYDARSNSFLGYDGDRHRCRSPYRY
jgi:hypothetical protein